MKYYKHWIKWLEKIIRLRKSEVSYYGRAIGPNRFDYSFVFSRCESVISRYDLVISSWLTWKKQTEIKSIWPYCSSVSSVERISVCKVIEKMEEQGIHCLPCSYTNDVIDLLQWQLWCHIDFKVTSSECHSDKVLSTTVGYSLVAIVTDLCRYLTNNSRDAMLLSSYKRDATWNTCNGKVWFSQIYNSFSNNLFLCLYIVWLWNKAFWKNICWYNKFMLLRL